AVAFEHDAGQRVFLNAHSIVLDLPMWMGIPVAAVVLALAAAWLVRQVRACNDGVRWSLLLAVAAIGLHALTEYPLDYAYFLLSLGLLIGTLDGLAPAARSLAAPRWSFIGPWAMATAMLVWVGVEYMKVEESARQVRMVLAGVGLDKQSFVPPPDTALLDGLREYHRFLITPARAGMSDAELDWMRDVMSSNPTAFAMVRYAQALGLNGRGDEAARVLRALCNIQTPKRCEQARESWKASQQEHPELASVPAP
ncbi:MAG: Wzy polymerase domain-containing protein, partial [Burkholderiales bacterium]